MSDPKTIHYPPPTIHQIEFVYFDLDDTLLDHRRAEQTALSDVQRQFGEHLGDFEAAHLHETYHTHNAPLWTAYAAGDIEKDTLKRLRFERFLDALAVTDLAPGDVGAFYMERYAEHWRLIDGAREAFAAIADRFPVGVLTNGFVETQHAKLHRFPALRDRLDALVISEDLGVLKPHPAVFAHATQAAGVEAAQILYVGDSYRSDVQGGRTAGWQVAWYTDGHAGDDAAEVTEDDGVLRFSAWSALREHLSV